MYAYVMIKVTNCKSLTAGNLNRARDISNAAGENWSSLDAARVYRKFDEIS
ncbi:MAG: hypothetical protein TECD_00618 [Hyphomicrobiaceae bacterium hypho_1]